MQNVDGVPTGSFLTITINGVPLTQYYEQARMDGGYWSFIIEGVPYLELQDSIIIENNLGDRMEYYVIFQRVMFANE